MAYDYKKQIREDIKDWVADNFEYIQNQVNNTHDREEIEEFLNDELWTEDSVTGNASGSYTFNRKEAEEYVKENFYLATEALMEFGMIETLSSKIEGEDWEYLDVTIRCYLLGEAIADVVDDIMNEIEEV